MKLFWIAMALLSGALLPLQAGLNTRMGKAIESPVHASMISFVVGSLVVLFYAILTRQHVSWAGLKDAPAHVWTAGALGAFYVTVVVLAFPRIGPALTFGLVVAGQMIMAIVLDHFNVLVREQHSINFWRIIGVALIIAGVVIVRKF